MRGSRNPNEQDATGHTIGEVLRKQTAACNADLLVMGAYGTFALSRMGPWGRDARRSITATAPRSVFALMVRDVAPAGSTSDGSLKAVGSPRPRQTRSRYRAQIREVQVLRRSGRFAAVASGLNQGEAIIAYASDHVGSGVRVALRQPSNLAGDR